MCKVLGYNSSNIWIAVGCGCSTLSRIEGACFESLEDSLDEYLYGVWLCYLILKHSDDRVELAESRKRQ